MTFITPVDGQPAVALHVAQLTEALSGVRAEAITLTSTLSVSGATSFAATPTVGGTPVALTTHTHTGTYLPLGGGTLTGGLTVSAGGVAVTGASTFSAAPTVGGSPLLTQSAGDARYTQGGITQAAADLRYEPIDTTYTKTESDARYALATALTALTARVTTLEGQVATLMSQMTGHTHQSGTVQDAGGTAIMP